MNRRGRSLERKVEGRRRSKIEGLETRREGSVVILAYPFQCGRRREKVGLGFCFLACCGVRSRMSERFLLLPFCGENRVGMSFVLFSAGQSRKHARKRRDVTVLRVLLACLLAGRTATSLSILCVGNSSWVRLHNCCFRTGSGIGCPRPSRGILLVMSLLH